MPKPTFVKKAARDYPEHGIAKGDPYWHWSQFRGPKEFSKTQPTPAQLAPPGFLKDLYTLQQSVSGRETFAEADLFQCEVEDLKLSLENMRDEEQEKLDNLPENFQEGEQGQRFQARVEALEQAIADIDGVDLTYEANDSQSVEEWIDETWQEVVEVINNIDCE